jgi:hypothetical protein
MNRINRTVKLACTPVSILPTMSNDAENNAGYEKGQDVQLETAFDKPSALDKPSDALQTIEEKKLVRKLDRRILPIACFLYLFACMFFFLLTVIPRLTDMAKIWTGPTWAMLVFKVYPRILYTGTLLAICLIGSIQHFSFHM